MPENPPCLNRRYQALDELIKELMSMSEDEAVEPCMDPGVKLMCNFWKILKEDPNCNLIEKVQEHLLQPLDNSNCYGETNYQSYSTCIQPEITCYMANMCGQGEEQGKRPRNQEQGQERGQERGQPGPIITVPLDPTATGGQTPCNTCAAQPLDKILDNLKKAASLDTSCNKKLNDLLEAEKNLRKQIAKLEKRERDGLDLLKEADAMWTGMEESYKKKINESLDRQTELMKQIEESAGKWCSNKKDLESQLDTVNKCQLEIMAKVNQKQNDLKTIEAEKEALMKRIENTQKETEAAKKSLCSKKQASDARIAKIAAQISKLEKELKIEEKRKIDKEIEGKKYIKEARSDLKDICKVLMQRRLEHEDLNAENNELLEEINILKDTCKACQERCAKKQQSLGEQIKGIDVEIANYELKCIRCNQCVETMDRKTCIDCPRCAARRVCKNDGTVCEIDPVEDCVCLKVKQQFLNNVFENMSIILQKKICSKAGKALGCEIANCLKNSMNGKLDTRTRRLLQEFVLQTVKRNLNLTIVGGAVKTRCELDQDTYKQLMLCLKQTKVESVPKSDKGTEKKDPCARWGGSAECNCPKGPKNCICSKKAPPGPKDPAKEPREPTQEEDQVDKCPHKSNAICNLDCGAFNTDRVGAEVAGFKPDPCAPGACPFGVNMRAAQCVLGPEPLSTPNLDTKHSHSACKLHNPKWAHQENKFTCDSITKPTCSYKKDTKQLIADVEPCNVKNEIISDLTDWSNCKTKPSADLIGRKKEINDCRTYCPETCFDKLKDFCQSSQFISKVSPDLSKDSNFKLHYKAATRFKNNRNKKFDDDRENFKKKESADSHAESYTEPLISYLPKKEETAIRTESIGLFNKTSEQEMENTEFKVHVQGTESEGFSMKIDEDLITILYDINKKNPKAFIYLKKTDSGHYYLDMNGSASHYLEKLQIRRTATDWISFEVVNDEISEFDGLISNSGSGMTVMTTTKSYEIDVAKNGATKNDFHVLKVEGVTNNVLIPPAILKKSPSFNYYLVVDKEFEKQYRDSFDSEVDEYCKRYVQIKVTDSSITVNFDKYCKKNAVLVKTSSKNIKIIVNGFERFVSNELPTCSQKDFQQFAELASKLPRLCKIMKSTITKVANFKSSSDSQIYKTSNIKLNILDKIFANLERTSSGQYLAVLDKESKKSIVDHLKAQLGSTSHKPNICLPIHITESGKLSIMLNAHVAEESQVGSMKITDSGNLYVVMDKSCLKMVKAGKGNASYLLQDRSKCIIKKNKQPKHKATCTTGLSKSEGCVCNSYDCVCDGLRKYQRKKDCNDFFVNVCLKYEVMLKSKEVSGIKDDNAPDSSITSATYTLFKQNTSTVPSASSSDNKRAFHGQTSCYDVSETLLCPESEHDFSTEILECTNLCSRIFVNISVSEEELKKP